MFHAEQHHMNYASVKARGVTESDSKYTLTVHKNPVKKSGYEFASELKKREYDSVKLYLSDGSDDAEYYDIERFDNSITRSKGSVVQYVANNPWELFVTLTVSPDSHADREDLKDCAKKVCTFFNNYKKRSAPNFKYLIIPEEHKETGWHFHGVLMGVNQDDMIVNENGYLDFKPYSERFGFFSMGKYGKVGNRSKIERPATGDLCSMGRIKDIKKCANYISKYISKEMFIGEQMAVGNHLFYASKGLKKDTLIVIGEPVVDPKEFLELGYDGFDNEHCTKVEFDQKEEAVKCVKPFAPDFKMGVSLSAYGDKIPLTKEKRQRLVRKAVSKFCNEFGMQVPSSQSGIEALWSEIMEKYCYAINDYDRIKEERRHTKWIAQRFVKGLTNDYTPCPFVDAGPPPNLEPEYENMSLLE